MGCTMYVIVLRVMVLDQPSIAHNYILSKRTVTTMCPGCLVNGDECFLQIFNIYKFLPFPSARRRRKTQVILSSERYLK